MISQHLLKAFAPKVFLDLCLHISISEMTEDDERELSPGVVHLLILDIDKEA